MSENKNKQELSMEEMDNVTGGAGVIDWLGTVGDQVFGKLGETVIKTMGNNITDGIANGLDYVGEKIVDAGDYLLGNEKKPKRVRRKK